MRLDFGPGPQAEVEAAGWSVRERSAFGAFALVLLATLPLLVHPWFDPRNDASIYIQTATALVDGEGYAFLGVPFQVRPPGFSLLLAPVIAWRGVDFFALNLWVSLLGAAGVLLLVAFARSRVGLTLALAVGVVVWLAPGYQLIANQVLSDVPGTSLWLGCLLVERWARRRPSPIREGLLGLAIGLSAYVRSITILLVPAILVARVLARLGTPDGPPWGGFALKRLGLFAVVAVAVLVPWSLRNASLPDRGSIDQTRLHSYRVAMLHVDPGDPGSRRRTPAEVVGVIPFRVTQAMTALGTRLQTQFRGKQLPVESGRPVHWLLSAILLGALGIVAVQRRAPAEIFALGTLAVIAVYFGFAPRLLLPVYLLAILATTEVARQLLSRWFAPRTATTVVAVALLATAIADWRPRDGWSRIESDHLAFVARAAAVNTVLDPDARVASRLGFHWSLYLDRPVYSLQQSILRAGAPGAAEPVLDRYSIGSVVLTRGDRLDATLRPYLEARYGAPVEAGDALVWQVRPAPPPALSAPVD